MAVCLHCLVLGNLLERAGLSGYLAVVVEQRLIIRGLCGKGRIRLGSGRGTLRNGCEGLCSLRRLLRRGLLIAETGLE